MGIGAALEHAAATHAPVTLHAAGLSGSSTVPPPDTGSTLPAGLDAPTTTVVAPTTTTLAPPVTTTSAPPVTTTTTSTAPPRTTTSTTSTTSTTVAPFTTFPAPGDLADCTAPEGGVRQPPTQAAFEQEIEHDWQLCKPPSVFGSNEAGIEITADHHWAKLGRDAAGRFVRLQGWGNQGTWQSTGYSMTSSPHWQLNLQIDGSGTVITEPIFAAAVPKMRLNNNGVYVADYLQLADGQVTGP